MQGLCFDKITHPRERVSVCLHVMAGSYKSCHAGADDIWTTSESLLPVSLFLDRTHLKANRE